MCMSVRHRCQQADSHMHECETAEATETRQPRFCPPILPIAVHAGARARGRACACACASACAVACTCAFVRVCALVDSKQTWREIFF